MISSRDSSTCYAESHLDVRLGGTGLMKIAGH